jgi:hypothetical protein
VGAAVAAQDVTSRAGHVQIARISGALPGILWLQQTLGAHLQYRRMKASEWTFSRWLSFSWSKAKATASNEALFLKVLKCLEDFL